MTTQAMTTDNGTEELEVHADGMQGIDSAAAQEEEPSPRDILAAIVDAWKDSRLLDQLVNIAPESLVHQLRAARERATRRMEEALFAANMCDGMCECCATCERLWAAVDRIQRADALRHSGAPQAARPGYESPAELLFRDALCAAEDILDLEDRLSVITAAA